MKRTVCFINLCIIVFLASCFISRPGEAIHPKYKDYKEIPGVTQADINAIEELRAKRADFVYGFPLSTEAFYEENGSLGGFVTLIYGRMSELFGFNFIPQVCDLGDLLKKIESQEIDFTSEFTATAERLEKHFMTDPIIQRSIKVFTHKNKDDLSVISKKRAIRCVFIKGSAVYPIVIASWNMPFEAVFVDDASEVVNYFVNDEIDAYIDESVKEALFDSYDFIESAEFYPLHYFPISLTTGNPELAPIINIMQKYLKNDGLEELAGLYNQGKKDYLKNKLFTLFTEEEKEYIRNHSAENTAIPIACEIDNYPACFYNQKEKEFQGTAIDVLDQIAELTDLRLKRGNRSDTTWSELLNGLETGKYSIVTELFQTNSRQGRFLWSEIPYYTGNYALLSRADYPYVDINQILFKKIGLLEGSAHTDVFREWFPGSMNTVTYVSMEEIFTALERGEIDLAMMTQNLLSHIVNYLEKPNFKANIVFNYSAGSYFGFNNNEEILCSIINKAQHFVDTEGIAERWKRKVFDYNSKMLKDMVPYVIIFSSLLMAAFLVVIFLFLKNKKLSKNLERLVAERAKELELQTSTLTTIFESTPDLVFCKDLDLRFTRCNQSFEKYFGCLEKDIIGQTDHGSGFNMSIEMLEGFRNADRRVIRERRTIVVEEVIPSIDGSFSVFETVKIPLVQDNETIGIIGISRNVTQRKTMEETIKLMFDNLDSCIFVSEPDTGKILFMNERMMKEFRCEDYNGKVCWEVIQNIYTERCDFCPVPKLIKSGEEYCVWEEHNTVTNKYYRNTDSLLKWHDGKIVHMQHSVDITDWVELQRDLEHASRAKGEFLSRMSHEIRTPLNAIIGMNSIVMNTDDLEKIHHSHERIDNASRHLLGIINDILDMSKIEAGKFELSSNEFDFEKMLINITNVVNFRVDEKKQNLVINLSKDVPEFIIADELRLSQVITNLLTNAVKFTPENGTIVLGIEKTSEVNEEITLQVEVADNGIGVSEEQKKRLFTSFEQADGSISRKFGGTGLGLAISKRIVELMGGRIWIDSEVGKGSKFTFTIKAQKSKEKKTSKLSTTINKDNLRILVVDDCIETREYFMHVMDAHHLTCDAACGGSEAISKIKNCGDRPYNIFFVDWQMPEMDGIELTRKIKEIVGDNAVVIMISVADWSSIEKEALSVGIERFIPKPLFPSAIINTINECIGVETTKAENQMQNKFAKRRLTFQGHTILVAEDVEVNREIISAVLEETQISIDFAENGQIAVSMFKEHPDKYSLIFMDIQMPEMDGYEATRKIRALDSPWAKDITIIAMTANVFREDIENCLSAGMNAHVGKPIDIDSLLDKLSQYLS